MFALLTVLASPRVILLVSAMLASLTVGAALRAIPSYPLSPRSPSSPMCLGSLSSPGCPAAIFNNIYMNQHLLSQDYPILL
jgi:hypothetical protein